jgi:hypothetical protein
MQHTRKTSMLLFGHDGGVMVAVLAIAIIVNVVFLAIFFSIQGTSKRSGQRRVKSTVLNIAEAGKEHLYAQIRARSYELVPGGVQDVFTNQDFNGGSYTVRCSTNTGTDTIWVRSRAVRNDQSRTVLTIATVGPSIQFNFPPVRGAVTARSNIRVNGNILVDGRDYDTLGTMMGSGLFGVSTCGLLEIEGSADIAGNGLGPHNKHNINDARSTLVQENAPVTDFFASPEAFLGVPEGALDEFKSTTLTTPFTGVRYITTNVNSCHFGSSYGILIVHNESKTAVFETNTGTFHGIIITDRLTKINGNVRIYGAIVTLTDGEVLSMSGTGTPRVLYSSSVLSNLDRYCVNVKPRIREIAWKETQ